VVSKFFHSKRVLLEVLPPRGEGRPLGADDHFRTIHVRVIRIVADRLNLSANRPGIFD
jgi:hypothetical protein